jgi:hypothetical protein
MTDSPPSDMVFANAAQRHLKRLYHWQRFDADRLEVILKDNTLYCSRPADFNDPWDCRPFFNTEQLSDPAELKKHIDWAVRVCRDAGTMSAADIARMQDQLRDPAVLERMLRQHTLETQQAVLERYRVYCLSPDATNALMWAHYADSHRGICLEFNVLNNVICCALEAQYAPEFPMTRQYSDDLADNLLPLLTKSNVWKYENEYRLIVQDTANATPHDTLHATNGFLKLPDGALRSIIVGCQGPYDAVRDLVRDCNPGIQVLRAHKIDNRYALEIRA